MKLLAAFAAVTVVSGISAAQAPQPVPSLPLVQKWVKFTDPQESAFAVEVPEGWKVSGGTVRRNALQYRSWVTVTAPDGATILAINDPTEWSYVEPTPMLAAAGFREGSIYGGGGGTTYTVAPYRDGAHFAAAWGQRKLASACGAVRLADGRARLDLTQQINGYARAYGIHHDVGEATFTCSKGGLAMTSYVLTNVIAIGGPAGTIWYADTILGFLSPTPMAGMAAGLMAHMVRSVEVNPAWVARQSQTNMDVSRIAAQTNAAMSNSIMRGWENRGAVIDRVMEEGSRARLGIDIYADPLTGIRYTVANAHKFYWVNPTGSVIGTETDTAPNGYTRLARVPP
ncbi:hypothetical protein [Paraburkholderia sp. EG304]|uniref:hypothetical protein n=1 Tax=Paraburkholderia sp. EG304 TaxID=3237015 RepID=UPI00397A4EE6